MLAISRILPLIISFMFINLVQADDFNSEEEGSFFVRLESLDEFSMFDLPNHEPSWRDLNENYFGENVEPFRFTWDQKLQILKNTIDENIVLPFSLVKSFILLAEKRILTRPPYEKLVPRINSHVDRFVLTESYDLMKEGRNKNNLEDYLNESFKSASRVNSAFSDFNFNAREYNPSVQILLSDDGSTGDTQLVLSYAKASGRLLFDVNSLRTLYQKGELLSKIQKIVHKGASPVIYIKDLNNYSDDFLKDILVLLENKILLGNASLIISIDGLLHSKYDNYHPDFDATKRTLLDVFEVNISENSKLIRKIAKYADGIHFVRFPQSAFYYKKIIENLVPKTLASYSEQYNKIKTIRLEYQSTLVSDLAEAVFELQQHTKQSLIKPLVEVISNPIEYRKMGRHKNLSFFLNGFKEFNEEPDRIKRWTTKISYYCESILGKTSSKESLKIKAKQQLLKAIENYSRAIEKALVN
ncbi:MAG: hypothetical protein H6625_03080 [Bdellovibrionaceae bacterium]|nr:hypothetical protein [Pseudobdellovibrionaceae bacterium]